MDAQSALDRLDQVLDRECHAIRRLDGAGVDAAAAEKLDLVRIVAALDTSERARLAPRIRALLVRLRHNGVLLAHARSILRDVLRVRGGLLPTSAQVFPGRAVSDSGARLSVRG
jgi:hypothetical protein